MFWQCNVNDNWHPGQNIVEWLTDSLGGHRERAENEDILLVIEMINYFRLLAIVILF